MSNHNDGGPAFPVEFETVGPAGDRYRHSTCGMTLRDWFAGQALVGLLNGAPTGAGYGMSSAEAYRFADAMLAAREKGDE